jgi:uncharacterized protein YacL
MNAVRSQQSGGSVSERPNPEGISEKASLPVWDSWVLRFALVGASMVLCYALHPFGLQSQPAAGLGFFVAMVVLLAELRLRRAEISGLMGGVAGGVVGLFASLLVTLVIARTSVAEPSRSFLEFTALVSFGYLGFVLGMRRGSELQRVARPPAGEANLPVSAPDVQIKLLDTSVLIDGRIADICETHFLDGTLGLPHFVLNELQLVADSSDSLKRQRGRRGLEVLHRLQKMPGLDLRLLDEDVTGVSAVDQKLVELAQRLGCKIVTNDFNLNKVARVHSIPVLNINELANALKPAVLPGEPMRVLILREGKEATQGVAYLDDGTMVVVDGARRLINRTVDITVTSVHQTPAGKMIFGRLEEQRTASGSVRAAAAAASGMRSEPENGGNGHSLRPSRATESTPAPQYPDADSV